MPSSWVMVLTWLVSLRMLSVAQDSALEEMWRDWKRAYEKVYTEEEEPFRRATWEKNLQLIKQHNREADEGKQTYWMRMNQFGDLSSEEFNRMMGNFHPDSGGIPTQGFLQAAAIQQPPKPMKEHHRLYGTSRKDQLDLTHTRKLGKHHSEYPAKPCLIYSKGTKKLLGRQCGCISRYRRRCQKCCKLAL